METSSNQGLSSESSVYNIFLHFLRSVDVSFDFNFFTLVNQVNFVMEQYLCIFLT